MHWFRFDIDPIKSETGHLSATEFAIYIRTLMIYYKNEEPLAADLEIIKRKLGLTRKNEISCLLKVAQEFFVEKEGFLHHKKADQEIKEYKEKGEKNTANINKRWAKKGEKIDSASDTSGNTNVIPNEYERNTNLTIKEFSNLIIQESNNSEDLREDKYARAREEREDSAGAEGTFKKPIQDMRKREDSAADASGSVAKAPVSKSPKKPKIIDDSFDFRGELIARGVEAENADTWIAVRAAKKAINNLVAIKLLEAQAAIAGMTTNDAVMTAAGSGWSGFKAAWVKDDMKLSQPKVQFKSAAERREENNQRVMEESIKRWEDRMKAEESAGIVVDASQLLN